MWWPHFHQWWRSGPSLWPMREPGCSFHIRLGRQWPLSLLDEERNWSFATPPWQQNGICIVCARHVPGPRIRNWQAERSVKYQWVKSCSAGAHYCQSGLRGCQLQEGQEIRLLCLPTGRPSLGLPDHQEISQNHLSKGLPKYAKVSSAETAAQNAVNLTGDLQPCSHILCIWIIWVWNAAMPRPSWIPSPSVSRPSCSVLGISGKQQGKRKSLTTLTCKRCLLYSATCSNVGKKWSREGSPMILPSPMYNE